MNDKNIKVGFDAKRYFHNQTGLGNYSRFVVDGLVNLYSFLDISLYNPTKVESTQKLVFSGKKGWFAKLWRVFGVANNSEFQKLDIYHGLSNEIPFKKSKVKTVVTIHDLIFKIHPEYYHPINSMIYNFKFKYACRNSDKIIAISKETKNDIVKFYGIEESKIEVIYQDCNPQFYDAESLKKEVHKRYGLPQNYILCTGTIEQRKSQLDLIKAFAKLDYDGDLVLLGRKTDYYKKIQSFLEGNGSLRKRVKVISNAEFVDFPAIYANAELFVYPSVKEGFGIPVLEALNAGTPVISTKGSVMAEVGENAILYFEPRNVEDLTNQMNTLLQDIEKQQELIRLGKIQALKFRKEVTLKQMVTLYQNII